MKILQNIANWIYLIFFSLVVFMATKAMINESVCSVFVCAGFILCFIFISKSNIKDFVVKRRRILWFFFQLASIVIMLVMINKLKVHPSWDWQIVIDSAICKVFCGEWATMEYFAKYPNNKFWLAAMGLIVKMIKIIKPYANSETVYTCTAIMSSFFLQLAMFFFYELAREFFKDEWKAFVTGISLLGALPMYMYAQMAYTDTISLLMVVLILYLFELFIEKKEKNSRYIYWILISILSVLIFNIKVMSFIVVIAIIITKILSAQNVKIILADIVLFLLIFITGVAGINAGIKQVVPISEELTNRYEYTWTHFIMMAMGETGGYSQDDITFSDSFTSKAEREKNELILFEQRIKEYGFTGAVNHIFNTKVTRTWGNSLLAADDYAHRNPYNNGGRMQRLFGEGEDLHWIVLLYSWAYHFFLLLGLLLAGVISVRNQRQNSDVLCGMLTLTGVGIFELIWECNSRYLFSYLPMIVLIGLYGWFSIGKEVENDK